MNAKLIIGITVLLILSASAFAGSYQVSTLYPEDYSVRSGLTYKVQYYEREPSGFNSLIKEENIFWNSMYPFKNPQNVYANGIDPVNKNVGFKTKIVRNPNMITQNDPSLGYVSSTLVFIPYQEAKETILYDKSNLGNYQTFAEKTIFDRYGNAQKSYNYGYTGKTPRTSFSTAYVDYDIRNPIYGWNIGGAQAAVSVNSKQTNLQATNTFNGEIKPFDSVSVENVYLYQVDPIEHYYRDPKQAHAFYGWTSLPSQTIVRDAFERVISVTNITYEMNKSAFEGCGAGEHSPEYNCYGNRCVQQSPTSIATFGGLGLGYDERVYDQSPIVTRQCWTTGLPPPNQPIFCIETYPDLVGPNAISSRITTKLDSCGNPVVVKVTGKYLHPFNDNDPLRAGLENLSTTTKVITSSYMGNVIKPYSVTTIGPPDVTLRAEYYGDEWVKSVTNERGIATNYEYDALGRVTKVIIPPDTNANPTMSYVYGYDSGQGMLKIYEKIKISETPLTYKQVYYFYDGLGRLTQTQTYDDNGTTATADDSIIINAKSFDVLGRVITQYRPVRVNLSNFMSGFGIYDDYFYSTGTHISYEYDSLNREIKATDSADGSVSTKDYSIESGLDKTTAADPANNQRTYYSDSRGNLVDVALPSP